MDLITHALQFASTAHEGHLRKGSNMPYILHPMEVAVIAASITSDYNVIAAALLHDVVEDTGVKLDDIRTIFGARVAELVNAESEDKRADKPPESTWRTRKEEAISLLNECNDRDVKIICLCDKLSNVRSMTRDYASMGDALWLRFHQTDPKQHGWYYRAMADGTRELSSYPAWQEYDRLIRDLFKC